MRLRTSNQLHFPTVVLNSPASPADSSIRKCAHGVYWPKSQRHAHGCQFCNPRLLDHDDQPSKTLAVFRLANGVVLQTIRMHSYGTMFEFGPGVNKRKFYHGSFAPGFPSDAFQARRDGR